MFNFSSSLKMHLCVQPTDMRKSFDGLYAIAKNILELNPIDGSLFIFCNKSHNRIKILYWDGTGFWVMAKRLEKGTFWWPKEKDCKSNRLDISPEALGMLLNGIDLKEGNMRPWFQRG